MKYLLTILLFINVAFGQDTTKYKWFKDGYVFMSNQVKRLDESALHFKVTFDSSRNVKSTLYSEYATTKDNWYSFSIYSPSTYLPDKESEYISEWHGVQPISSPISFGVNNGRYYLNIFWDSNTVTQQGKWAGFKGYGLDTVLNNVWVDWVFHISFSYTDGIVEVWKDGKLVINYRGGNCWNEVKYPYWSIGLSKWVYLDKKTKHQPFREIYIADFKWASGNITYEDMKPTPLESKLIF